MRHGNSFKKLNRTPSHRRALLRNMATSFLASGKIETTVPKAKALRPVVEKIITKGKEDTLSNRRYVLAYLTSKEVVSKLFSEIAPKYSERNGGYTRIVRTRTRLGDATEMAVLALV